MTTFVSIPADPSIDLSLQGAMGFTGIALAIKAQYIERVRVSDTLALAVDDSGLLLRKPENERASILYGKMIHGHSIYGDALLGVESFVGGVNAGIDWVEPVKPQDLLARVRELIEERRVLTPESHGQPSRL